MGPMCRWWAARFCSLGGGGGGGGQSGKIGSSFYVADFFLGMRDLGGYSPAMRSSEPGRF